VTVERGHVRCAVARRVLRKFLSGGGVEHGSGPESNRTWTIGRWRCGHGTGGGACIRGGSSTANARDWIIAQCAGRCEPASSGSSSAVSRPLATAALHCAGIYWRTIRNGPQLCPRKHSLLADVSLVRLRWSSWGGSVANAIGYSAHTVFPNNHLSYELTSVAIRLSRPRTCSDHVRIYSYYEATDYSKRGHRRTGHGGYAITCKGEAGGGNG
jgi:hypothetical protein